MMDVKSVNPKKNIVDIAIDLILSYKSLFILLIIVIGASSFSEYFLSFNNIRNVIRSVAVSSILALGFTLVLGSGHIDLSVGCQLGLIGAVMGKLSKVPNMPIVVVFIVGIVMGIFTGGFNGLLINIFNLPPFIVTLSTASVYKGFTYLYTEMVPVSNLPVKFTNLGQGYIGIVPIPVIFMFIALAVMWFIVKKTLFGRHVLAMGGNKEAASVCGIDIKKIRLAVFSVMGMYAAIAGFVLTARNASAQVGAGQGMEMNAIAAVVLGGTPMGGGYAFVPNTIIGCLIVGVVTNTLNLLGIDTNWQEVAKGTLIVFAIILDTQSTNIRASREKKRNMRKRKKETSSENGV